MHDLVYYYKLCIYINNSYFAIACPYIDLLLASVTIFIFNYSLFIQTGKGDTYRIIHRSSTIVYHLPKL